MRGENIVLRALEPEDADFLYEIENDENLWEISQTQTPFSKFILKDYIKNAHLDIYTAKQVRFIIEKKTPKEAIGMIDLFDFDPKNKRAGIGILLKEKNRKNGYASEALYLLIEYSFSILHLHQIHANIIVNNNSSIKLFEKFNFQKVGVKKDWIYTNNEYKDEILYQLINE